MQNPYGQYAGGGQTPTQSPSKGITVADLVAGAGGVVTLIFSFLAFFEFGGESRNAWSRDAGAFVTTIPAILGLAMAALIGLGLGGAKLPDKVLTFNWDQIAATWGITAAAIMVAYLTTDTGADKGIGFWFMLLGSLAMATGAILKLLGLANNKVGGSGTSGGSQPAQQSPPPDYQQSGGYQQPGGAPPPGGYQQPGGSQQPGQDGSTPPPPPSY